MPHFEFQFKGATGLTFPETPRASFGDNATLASFAASGSIDNSEPAEFCICDEVDEGSWFNSDEYPSDFWWSAEFAGHTNKDSSGNLTNWKGMHDVTDGTTQTVSYRKPIWEDNKTNGFPHVRVASGDYVDLDTTISYRASDPWTIVLFAGDQAPSLYGAWLGSLSNTTTIKSAYHWQGRRLRLKNELGEDFAFLYSSTDSSEYGGGAQGLHVLRCDGSDVYIRWNGRDLGSGTPTSSAQYNFSRLFHYQTSSTQQNSSGSLHEIVAFPYYISGTDLTDLEGYFMTKYDTTRNVPSTHPYYGVTSTNYYKTPKVDTSMNKTTSNLSLSSSNQNFSMSTTTLSANSSFTIYPLDLGNPGTIDLKVQWT